MTPGVAGAFAPVSNRSRRFADTDQIAGNDWSPLGGRLMLIAAVVMLGACGTTYIDSEITVPGTAVDATISTLAPVDPEAPTAELLAEIETLMIDLDERIIDQRDQVAQIERIEELWRAAERQIRATDPDDLFNFEQAIDLARSGVDRRRPADASKGYKIIIDVIDDYLARG